MSERRGGYLGCQREGETLLVVREEKGGYLCWLPHKAGTQLLETFLWDLPWGEDDSQHLPSLFPTAF